MKDRLEVDMKARKEAQMDDMDEDFNLKYPKFLEMTVIKADKYK